MGSQADRTTPFGRWLDFKGFMRSSRNIGDFYLLRVIPSFFILDSSVVGFRPKVFAAPLGPLTRHPVSSNTLRI
jgi:hypothetical protein